MVWCGILVQVEIFDLVELFGIGFVVFGVFVFDEELVVDSVFIVLICVFGRYGYCFWEIWICFVFDFWVVILFVMQLYGLYWVGMVGLGVQSLQGYQDFVWCVFFCIVDGELSKVVFV